MNVDCLTNEDEAFDLCSKRFYQMAFLSNTLDNMSGIYFILIILFFNWNLI